MTELVYRYPLTEREDFIESSSVEVRMQAQLSAESAEKYNDVLSGDAQAVRDAAHWLIHNAFNPRSIELDDAEQIESRKEELLAKAAEKTAEADRLESWAASLYDHRDSKDVIALKSLRRFKGLDLARIDKNPKSIVNFEDKLPGEEQKIRDLIGELNKVRDAINFKGSKLSMLDLTDAVKRIKVTENRPINVIKLALLQEEIVIEKIESAKTELETKTAIVATLRTGVMPENLKPQVLAKNPNAFSYNALAKEQTAYDDYLIEELELGVRSYNCLKKAGFQTIGEVLSTPLSALRAVPNFGKHSQDELIEALHSLGLSLAE